MACVGLRRSASSEPTNVFPSSNTPATHVTHNIASTSRLSSLPQQSDANATVNDYLVGAQLDEALAAGQDVVLSWPFADGDVRDWTQAEAIWYVGPVLLVSYDFTILYEKGSTYYSRSSNFDESKTSHRFCCL